MLDDASLCSSFGACSSLGTFTVTWKEGLLSLEYISSLNFVNGQLLEVGELW